MNLTFYEHKDYRNIRLPGQRQNKPNFSPTASPDNSLDTTAPLRYNPLCIGETVSQSVERVNALCGGTYQGFWWKKPDWSIANPEKGGLENGR